jgi:hypothetical protein
VAIDLLLSFRAASDWPAMISLVADMPGLLRGTAMAQEQLASR